MRLWKTILNFLKAHFQWETTFSRCQCNSLADPLAKLRLPFLILFRDSLPRYIQQIHDEGRISQGGSASHFQENSVSKGSSAGFVTFVDQQVSSSSSRLQELSQPELPIHRKFLFLNNSSDVNMANGCTYLESSSDLDPG